MIYKILSDDAYGVLYPDFKGISLATPDRRAFLAGRSGEAAFGASWVEQAGLLENGSQPADISRLGGFHLVLSPGAQRILVPLLNMKGEWLPVLFHGETYQLFNCRHLIDAVIPGKSRLNEYAEIEELVLNENVAEGETLWGTKFGVSRALYCTEPFKQAVETAGLTGLRFSTDLTAR